MAEGSVAETVLVIEDNEQNRYLASFSLEWHGYEVARSL